MTPGRVGGWGWPHGSRVFRSERAARCARRHAPSRARQRQPRTAFHQQHNTHTSAAKDSGAGKGVVLVEQDSSRLLLESGGRCGSVWRERRVCEVCGLFCYLLYVALVPQTAWNTHESIETTGHKISRGQSHTTRTNGYKRNMPGLCAKTRFSHAEAASLEHSCAIRASPTWLHRIK